MDREARQALGDGIYGPSREEAQELNKTPGRGGKKPGLLKSAWGKALIGATVGAGALTGSTPSITPAPEAFADNPPPAIETPDHRSPSPAEVQGIVIPLQSTESTSKVSPLQKHESSEVSLTPQPSKTPEPTPTTQQAETTPQSTGSTEQNVYRSFTQFTADQDLNPDIELKFSAQELEMLKTDWERVVKHLQEKYGPEIIDKEIIFYKILPESKPGHGHFTRSITLKKPDGSRFIQMQFTEVNAVALDEFHHELGHELFPGFYPGDHPTQIDYEWSSRMSEAVATLIQDELLENPELHPTLKFMRERINYYKDHVDSRRDPEFASKPFLPLRPFSYYVAGAAAVGVIQEKYVESGSPPIINTLKAYYATRDRDKIGYDDVLEHLVGVYGPEIKTDLQRETVLTYNPSQ